MASSSPEGAWLPSVQAYDTATTKVSCSAVKSHKKPSKSSTAVGIGYERDRVRVNGFACKAKEGTWYSRGTLTRRSDGKRVREPTIHRCVNPFGAIPPPVYPKRV